MRLTVTYGNGFSLKGKQAMRERVERLEQAINQLPQAECPVSHHFAPGMYAREISLKAGTVITGAIHKTEHFIVVSKGRLKIVTDEGATEVTAPHLMRCTPGMKNAVYALEDSVWTNFFPTTETDPDKLVEILTESKASELLGGSDNKQLAANKLKGTSCHLE